MATIITRAGKGSPLTNNEVDANFNNLNSDKLEVNNASATGTFGLTGTLGVTGTAYVDSNSSSDALRITQTGTGNALVVEDSANPDATPFVVNASGNVVQGNTSPLATIPFYSTGNVSTPALQGISAAAPQLGITGHSSSQSFGPAIALSRASGDSVSSPTAVSSGFDVGAISFSGHDGTGFVRAAQILAEVDGTPGTNDMPGRLVFSTTADGASSPTERMRIDNAGQVRIGSGTVAAPALSVLTDTNTGVFFPAADTVAIVTAGTERLRIDSAGKADFSGDVELASINNGPLAGFRNAIINGNFDIWQRGTSGTSIAAFSFLADRWKLVHSGATVNASRQAFTVGQTDVPGEPQYFHRVEVTSVVGADNYSLLEQPIEGVRTFAGQQVTLSFYAKANATKNVAVEIQQGFGSGGSPSSAVFIYAGSVTLGTTWAKHTLTFNVTSISGKTLGTNGNDTAYLHFWFDAGSNLNSRTGSLGHQSGTFDIAQVQLEAGPVATPFERRPIGTELALCQRYYQQYKDPPARGVAGSATNISRVGFSFPVIMRVAPTGSLSGSLNWFDGTGNVTISAFLNTYSTPHSFEFDATTAGTAAYRPIIIYIGGNTGTINLSAEL